MSKVATISRVLNLVLSGHYLAPESYPSLKVQVTIGTTLTSNYFSHNVVYFLSQAVFLKEKWKPQMETWKLIVRSCAISSFVNFSFGLKCLSMSYVLRPPYPSYSRSLNTAAMHEQKVTDCQGIINGNHSKSVVPESFSLKV